MKNYKQQRREFVLLAMKLIEKSLKKWFRDFAEYRLKLTRPVNESLKKLIADEKL